MYGRRKTLFRLSELSRDVSTALSEMGLPVMQSMTIQRQIYPKTAAMGLTPADSEPDGEAAKEIKAIIAEIASMIEVNI